MRLGSGCYKNINSTHTYGNLQKDWGQGQAVTGEQIGLKWWSGETCHKMSNGGIQ